jgi:hypothetical protein
MKNNIARQTLAETSEEAKAKVKQYAKKAIAEHLFDPDKSRRLFLGANPDVLQKGNPV